MATQLQYGLGGGRAYSLYYRHSGKTPILSILLAGLAGIVVGVVVAYAYAYADAYCPYAKLRAIAAVVFGACLGGATAAIAKAGKVRSLAVVLALVGAVTLVALYVTWAAWVVAVLDRVAPAGQPSGGVREAVELMFSPAVLLDVVRAVNHSGYWSLSSTGRDAPSGTFLTLIWLTEGLAVLGTALGVAYAMARSRMFCERCNRWCSPARPLMQTAAGDAGRARQALEAHDFSYLRSLGPQVDPARGWTLDYERCAGCDELHAVSLREHAKVVDKKGRVKRAKTKTLVDRLLVESSEVGAITAPVAVAAIPVAEPAPDEQFGAGQ